MIDEDLRRLERAWRTTGDWDAWETWARRTRGSIERDAARLLAALLRLRVLHQRRARVGSRAFPAAAEQEDRLQWIRDRIADAFERTLRRVGLLGRVVPHPHTDAEDWRASGVALGVGSRRLLRAARPVAHGRRRSTFAQSVARTAPFQRGRTLTADDTRRVRDAIDQTRGAHTIVVVNLDGGDVEVRDGNVLDPAAAAAFARSTLVLP